MLAAGASDLSHSDIGLKCSQIVGADMPPSTHRLSLLSKGPDIEATQVLLCNNSKTFPVTARGSRASHSIRSSFTGLRAPGLPLRLLALPFCGARLPRPFPGGGRTKAKSTSIV